MKIRQKIYIRNIKHFTDIDPAVDFVFPVNKIDREKGEKTIGRITVMCTSCLS
jgi:hypothetical protein